MQTHSYNVDWRTHAKKEVCPAGVCRRYPPFPIVLDRPKPSEKIPRAALLICAGLAGITFADDSVSPFLNAKFNVIGLGSLLGSVTLDSVAPNLQVRSLSI